MADTYHPRGELVDGHRVREHPLYWTWADMKSRCNDAKQANYNTYGGRGVSYSDEWRHFARFAQDMGPKPTVAHTLERQDVNGDYCVENCVWATRTEQCLNRRMFKNNTTGVRGVVRTRTGSFEARYDYQKKRYHIGHFPTLPEAAAARSKFVEEFVPT